MPAATPDKTRGAPAATPAKARAEPEVIEAGPDKPEAVAEAKAARDKAVAEAEARDKAAAESTATAATGAIVEPAKLVPADIQQALSQRGHALLIGVSDYTSRWDPLPSVKDDLQYLKTGLELNFQTVETVLNPTMAQLRKRMRDFLLGQWNKPKERLFIYYSGHGFTDFNQNSHQNDGYITGSDTPLFRPDDGRAIENAVPFTEIESWSRQTKALHVLMVFDSAFSGSLFEMKGPPPPPSKNDFTSIDARLHQPIRYFITSGRQNEAVSADSTFAKLLLKGLRGDADRYHEGIISADELGTYLYHEVPKYSAGRQTPQFASIGNVRLSEGQFFFLTSLAAAGTSAPLRTQLK